MTSKKISAFPNAGALDGSELVPLLQAGDDAKTTAQDIADLAVVADGSITTAKFAPGAKAPLAGTADLATLAVNVTNQPLRTRKCSQAFSAFTPAGFCEIALSGIRKLALFGNAGTYAYCDPDTGAMSASATIAALTGKDCWCALWLPTISRILWMATDGSLWIVDYTTGGTWTATSLAVSGTTNCPPIYLTGHNEFLYVHTDGQTLKRFDASVNPPTLIASYQPQNTLSFGNIAYDSVGDSIFACVNNVGNGTNGGRIYKVPRGSFASFTTAQTTAGTQQNPGAGSSPPVPYAVVGDYLFAIAKGSTGGQLYNINTMSWVGAVYGIDGGQFITNGSKIVGCSGSSRVSAMRVDPNAGDPICEVVKPLDVMVGTSPVGIAAIMGTDNFLYLLCSVSTGFCIYQIVP